MPMPKATTQVCSPKWTPSTSRHTRSSPDRSRASSSASQCVLTPPEVIVLAVRWYLRFALSYRDVEGELPESDSAGEFTQAASRGVV